MSSAACLIVRSSPRGVAQLLHLRVIMDIPSLPLAVGSGVGVTRSVSVGALANMSGCPASFLSVHELHRRNSVKHKKRRHERFYDLAHSCG